MLVNMNKYANKINISCWVDVIKNTFITLDVITFVITVTGRVGKIGLGCD